MRDPSTSGATGRWLKGLESFITGTAGAWANRWSPTATADLRNTSATCIAAARPAAEPEPTADKSSDGSAWALAGKHGCIACHGIEAKLVGPGFREAARRHAGRPDPVAYLTTKIRSGGLGVWGNVAMPPQALPEADARSIASWIVDGASDSAGPGEGCTLLPLSYRALPDVVMDVNAGLARNRRRLSAFRRGTIPERVCRVGHI